MSPNLLFGIMFFVLAGFVGFLGMRRSEESHVLGEYIPADTIQSIPFGVPVIATGTVVTQSPLTTPITQKPCVYYSYLIEREEEVYNRRGRPRFEWQSIGEPRTQSIPFFLQDGTGQILVKPEGCTVSGINHTEQLLQPGSIPGKSSPVIRILSSISQIGDPLGQGRERATEYAIFTGSPLNIFGILTMEGEQKFFQTTQQFPLILSPLSKDQVLRKQEKKEHIFYGLAVILFAIGIVLLTQAGF